MSYEKIIKEFDKNIWWQKKTHESIKDCPSYWKKQIFVQSFGIGINDWRGIRAGNYYEIKDHLTGIDRDKFILNRIREYKKS